MTPRQYAKRAIEKAGASLEYLPEGQTLEDWLTHFTEDVLEAEKQECWSLKNDDDMRKLGNEMLNWIVDIDNKLTEYASKKHRLKKTEIKSLAEDFRVLARSNGSRNALIHEYVMQSTRHAYLRGSKSYGDILEALRAIVREIAKEDFTKTDGAT